MDAQSTPRYTRPQRVLACTLCSQRKVKCDRTFPCANCVKAGVPCIPAALVPRQRKRRFPERELLDRLQRYEELLSQNNINFERASDPSPGPGSPAKSETVYEAKSLWKAMTQVPDGDLSEESEDSPFNNDMRDTLRRRAWEHLSAGNDQLLFGPRRDIDLSTLHPSQGQIFKLWQVYLENVDPLLKVTHTPTLQPRIIDAATDLANIPPELEALMFSIYCIATLSLADESRKDVLREYQVGCQQALINCGFLRAGDRESLTAFFFYLISLRADLVDPRQLSPMFGMAIRIGQRIGLHNEALYAKLSPLEAEMRRRLWWAIVIFDQRIGELGDAKATALDPTWDCRTPVNVNDFDLRLEMKGLPSEHGPSEALFAVVRCEIADTTRHSDFHLDFTAPALKAIARPEGSLAGLERRLEEKYLRHCNLDNPLHFITVWIARGSIAKLRLLEHFAKRSPDLAKQSDDSRDAAVRHAIDILISDTALARSPRIKGFYWLIHYYFPLPAYMNIAQDLAKRPFSAIGEHAWAAMSDNYQARFPDIGGDAPIFSAFARLILFAWRAREAAFRAQGQSIQEPEMVASVRERLEAFMGDVSGQQKADAVAPGGFVDLPSMDFDFDALDWTTIDWNPMPGVAESERFCVDDCK